VLPNDLFDGGTGDDRLFTLPIFFSAISPKSGYWHDLIFATLRKPCAARNRFSFCCPDALCANSSALFAGLTYAARDRGWNRLFGRRIGLLHWLRLWPC